MEGPWGLPPPVLRNLSLENCKFISQKGPRAEMTSKRTNHFLQSLTELGLGGVVIGGGAPFRLVHPHVFPQPTPGSGPREMGQRVGAGACMGRGASQPKVHPAHGTGHFGVLEEGQGPVPIPHFGLDPPALNL